MKKNNNFFCRRKTFRIFLATDVLNPGRRLSLSLGGVCPSPPLNISPLPICTYNSSYRFSKSFFFRYRAAIILYTHLSRSLSLSSEGAEKREKEKISCVTPYCAQIIGNREKGLLFRRRGAWCINVRECDVSTRMRVAYWRMWRNRNARASGRSELECRRAVYQNWGGGGNERLEDSSIQLKNSMFANRRLLLWHCSSCDIIRLIFCGQR